jgi:hypothetical protein
VTWLTADLADLTDRRAGRAAVILVVSHVLIGLGGWLLWAFGWLPIFDHVRFVPVVLVTAYSLVLTIGILLRFGFWAVSVVGGFGERYTETFSTGRGIALGLVRLLSQLGLVLILLPPVMMTIFNMRWWHVAGTDELDALPARAATIPVPADWSPVTGLDNESRTGLLAFMEEDSPEGTAPEGFVQRAYTVPNGTTAEDLRTWMTSDAWTETGAFGELAIEECDSSRPSCDAHLVPPTGSQPEYFVTATGSAGTTLILRLEYRAYEQPDWDVSKETVDRAMAMPIPSDWTLAGTTAQTKGRVEVFASEYGVPVSFTGDDLEAWLEGDAWTDPGSGTPFGELGEGGCVHGEGIGHSCGYVVVGGSPDHRSEGLSLVLDEDHTLTVSLERVAD